MTDGIESALLQLISKVETSQSLIDELEIQVQQLKLKLESQEIANKKSLDERDSAFLQLRNLQEELEYYFLLSRKQLEVIKANESLYARASALLVSANFS